MKLNRRVATIAAMTIATLGLTACSIQPKGTTYSELMQDPTVTRSINHDLLVHMREGGVIIIRQGSRLQFVLPVDRFFKAGTMEVRLYRVPTLQLISMYLHNYVHTHHTHYPITVYAYVDDVPYRADRYEYSKQFAQVIASYLWSHGFSPQQMRVVGFGDENPIASNFTAVGSADNQRVVIQVN